jgi:hypothetical protein
LLLNVALHGMEQAAGVRYRTTGVHAGQSVRNSPVVIRYADDLVALCHTRDEAEQVKARLAAWLAPRGLTFNEDKTRVVTLDEGFDFLGFTVRRQAGKLLIKPSKAALRRIRERLRTEMRALRGANAALVLVRLNPIIRTPDMVRKSLRGQRWVLASGRRTRSMPGNGLWAAARCSHSLPPACATRVEGRWVVITLTISPLIRPKTPHGFISHQSRGDEPEKHESAGQRAAAAPRPTAMSGPLIIRGWAAYYRTVVSSEAFNALDRYLWRLTYKWAKFGHPNKSRHWVVNRYFGAFNRSRRDHWVFGDRDSGAYHTKFAWTSIVRHRMVKGGSSPDDPSPRPVLG